MATKIEKQVNKAPTPPTSEEILNKTQMLFVMNGFKVVNSSPKRLEFGSRHAFISPVNFSVNGIEVSLFGSRLVVDGKIHDDANTFDAISCYKEILKVVKNKRKVARQAQSTMYSRYMAYVCAA